MTPENALLTEALAVIGVSVTGRNETKDARWTAIHARTHSNLVRLIKPLESSCRFPNSITYCIHKTTLDAKYFSFRPYVFATEVVSLITVTTRLCLEFD